MIILAFVLPPLAVLLATHNPVRALLNLLLTFMLWIPGVIHALACVNEAKTGKMIRQAAQRD